MEMADSDKQSELQQQSRNLVDFILAGEQSQADKLLADWADHNGHRSAICNILEPALEEIGRLWETENISLAAGYLAGKVAETILQRSVQKEESLPLSKGPVIIGNIEDDYHSLGRRLIGIFLATAGWKVIDLGNDITPKEFVDAAIFHKATIIGASAMMFTTAQNIKKLRIEIDQRGLKGKIKLAAGGAVFKARPELVVLSLFFCHIDNHGRLCRL